MHAIHHTEAIILRSAHSGEANKRLWLLTKNFGLIVASVQGVRKSGAKLQSQIADYSTVMADLIKGREVWKLVSASVVDVPVSGNTRNPLSRAYVRTLSLLVRFMVGEGVHDEIYNHVKECAEIVKAGKADARTLDAISIWKILAMLGYIAPRENNEAIFRSSLIEALEKITDEKRIILNQEARHAISQSHL